MRELGFGDTVINKNMKTLVKVFYNILLKSENYQNSDNLHKNVFFNDHLEFSKDSKSIDNQGLMNYFDKYLVFCLDLSSDNVLKGNLNFNIDK